MSILKKTSISIDLDKLREWYRELSKNNPPCSEQRWDSDAGRKLWQPGSVAYGYLLHDQCDGIEIDQSIVSSYKRGVSNSTFNIQNEFCKGYMGKILENFPEAFRANAWTIKPPFRYNLHRDRPWNSYRVQIALHTNPGCNFLIAKSPYDENCEEYSAVHIPTDGYLYFLDTEKRHGAENFGDKDRTHILWQMPIETYDKYSQMELHIDG
jgi:hypothetical protein